MLKLRIAQLLKDRNLTTQAFAAEAGLSYNTALSLKREGTNRIDLLTLEKVCKALGIAPGEAFDFRPEPKRK